MPNVQYPNATGQTTSDFMGVYPNGLQWNLKGDYQETAAGMATSGAANVVIATTSVFSSADVGKVGIMRGAGVAGADVYGTITGYTSPTTVTVSFTASTAVVGGTFAWGTDNSPGLTLALSDLKDGKGGCGLTIPSGSYLMMSTVKLTLGTHIKGASCWVHHLGTWSATTFVQGPGMNADLFVSEFDPAFGGTPDWLHAGSLEDIMLWGDRRTNKRGRGLNLYRLGENFRLNNVKAYGFPRDGIRVYDYAAPNIVGNVSCFVNGTRLTVTADATTDKLSATAHGLLDGEIVRFHSTGSVPAGLTAYQDYYVVSSATNDFKVSATSGGAAINLTSAGSGTISCSIGSGFLYDCSPSASNTLGQISGDNNAVALLRATSLYKTRLTVLAIKSERSTIATMPFVGNDCVVSVFNANGGGVDIDQLNVYASTGGGNAIIQQTADASSSTGKVDIKGGIDVYAGHETAYAYGYQNLSVNVNLAVTSILNRPLMTEAIQYMGDRTNRELKIANVYGGLVLSHDDTAPNVITHNAVNFGNADQGGFISVNSRFSGDYATGWVKTSTNASNKAMFMRLAAALWEIRYGTAAGYGSTTDPGDPFISVLDDGRTFIGRKAKNAAGTQTLKVCDAETGGATLFRVQANSGQTGYIGEFLDTGGVARVLIDYLGNMEVKLNLKLSNLTANRPLKLSGNDVTADKIDLGGANDVTGTVSTVNGGTGGNYADFAALVAAVKAALGLGISDISGLTAALAGKSDVGHTHTFTGSALAGHSHTVSGASTNSVSGGTPAGTIT